MVFAEPHAAARWHAVRPSAPGSGLRTWLGATVRGCVGSPACTVSSICRTPAAAAAVCSVECVLLWPVMAALGSLGWAASPSALSLRRP